jgi:hypothetical protein
MAGRRPDVQEITPGIFHWTAFHEPIDGTVSSYYVAPAGVVIDPKQPEGGWEELPDKPQQILLTSGHHLRDAGACAETFGIPIRASHEAIAHIGDGPEIEPFEHHDDPAPGITAIHIGKLSDDEGAFHIAVGEGAVAFADGINRYGGALGFFPDSLLGAHPDRVKEGLKQAFSGLLHRDFDVLLFAHGDPLVGGGKAALRTFVTSPVGNEEFGQAL